MTSCLVIMNWDLVVLSFDSVRFEKFKAELALRTLDWKDSVLATSGTQTYIKKL